MNKQAQHGDDMRGAEDARRVQREYVQLGKRT